MAHVLVRLFGPETLDHYLTSFLAYSCIIQMFLIHNHDLVVLYHFQRESNVGVYGLAPYSTCILAYSVKMRGPQCTGRNINIAVLVPGLFETDKVRSRPTSRDMRAKRRDKREKSNNFSITT